ncbi:dipeptidase PepV [Robertmurraya korlensis]|uniref:dipeptidase PepV n=1 Tax=Robertmurraya korlensis TaxID=519977 RepID=UPI0008265890|nr:dipeptidase PepV [Robertmurraya korlensis]
MTNINWVLEVEKRKESLIEDTRKLLQIKSVLDEENATDDAPLGQGVKDALDHMLQLGKVDGFSTKNVGNLAGHVEFGEGTESVGILCHVDVVPEGDGWASDPYAAEIRDGNIYARGAIDDKGPTMAAYYAMKIVKELQLPLSKRVRMIIGTDEESNWRCVDHYFEHEEMPTFGFAPDADFPIIFAEKGISDFDIVQKSSQTEDHSGTTILSFQAGRRYNMVPDFAKVALHTNQEETHIIQEFQTFLDEQQLKGKYFVDKGELVLELEGVSVHGMEPDLGKNAGILLAAFLNKLQLSGEAKQYFSFIQTYFYNDSRGKQLGIAYTDDISGDITLNVGKLSFTKGTGGMLGINLRYPVTATLDQIQKKLAPVLHENGFEVQNLSDSKPHHVDEKDFLIQTLKKVYEEQTGEKAELMAIGGGTYARSLKSGVAFGPLFPGRPDVAHQKDEYMVVEDLFKATAIYAQAIYELAK